VRGARGRRLRFRFTASLAIGVRGPAVSLDAGETWGWLGHDTEPNAFSYEFADSADEVRFSFGMPYQAARWEAFIAARTGNPLLATGELCRTPKGRPVEMARFGCLARPPAHQVALACRHHCCEMMADYALEGVVDFVLADPSPAAAWLRDNVEFLAVPFIDKDGVEDGDQGKNRRPRDHGRDYAGDSLYAAPRALRRLLSEWSQGRLAATVDLHCPWIHGLHNEVVYLVGTDSPGVAAEQQRFSRLLEQVCRGPLPFRADDFLPFGAEWNTDANYAAGDTLSRWSAQTLGVRLATGIELPYANVAGATVDQKTARAFGPDLARALAAYLGKA